MSGGVGVVLGLKIGEVGHGGRGIVDVPLMMSWSLLRENAVPETVMAGLSGERVVPSMMMSPEGLREID